MKVTITVQAFGMSGDFTESLIIDSGINDSDTVCPSDMTWAGQMTDEKIGHDVRDLASQIYNEYLEAAKKHTGV
jgi:hypothetical protein